VIIDYDNAHVILTRQNRKEAINDLKYSPDGTVLASAYACVSFHIGA